MRLVKLLLTFETLGNRLDDAFRQFDRSGDDEIAVDELHRGLMSLGAGFENLRREDVELIVQEACCLEEEDGKQQQGGGGHMSRREFMAFVEAGRVQLLRHS